MKILNFILVILVAASISKYYSNADDNNDSYMAAVVDYAPVIFEYDQLNKTTATLYMMENLKYFSQFTTLAKENGAQIILFNEYGICGSWTQITDRQSFYYFLEDIPDPTKDSAIVACNNTEYLDRPVFSKLSCIAKENSIYLVVDYVDLKYCDNSTDKNCPSDGRYQYNAELAFSPNGSLIAKYYKSHLFDEAKFANYPPYAEPVYFDTDFGVRFGMFICFDLMFKYPQTDLIEKFGVKNILYSTEWINNNIIPANGIQQGWSYYNGINLLASNSGSDKDESGSGIYSNGEVLAYTINSSDEPKSTLLISKVPKSPLPSIKNFKQFSKTIELKHTNKTEGNSNSINNSNSNSNSNKDNGSTVNDYITPNERLDTTNIPFTPVPFQLVPNKEQTVQAVNGDLTCTFTYTSVTDKNQLLALLAYDGIFQNDEKEEAVLIQVCSVFICSGPSVDTCNNLVFDSDVKLSSFYLHGTFKNGYQIYPIFNNRPFEKSAVYNETTQTLYAEGIENYSFIGASFFNPNWANQTRVTSPSLFS